MKRKIKTALAVIGAISIPVAINHLIFTSVEKKADKKIERMYYNWTYGDIHYVKAGSGKPLLLIHSLYTGSSHMEWENSISDLSKDYTVYAIDLLGYGYSSKPALIYSSYLYIQLINDFIKNVIKEKAYVVGSNGGASLALGAHCINPETIEKLMLISPVGAGTTKSEAKNSDTFLKKLLDSPIIGTSYYNMISSKLYSFWFNRNRCFCKYEKKPHDKSYEASHIGGANAKLPISALLSSYLSVDIERLISGVSIPIYIIWGEKNELNPSSNYEILKECNKKIKLAIFRNTKLLPHKENEKAFYNSCKSFF